MVKLQQGPIYFVGALEAEVRTIVIDLSVLVGVVLFKDLLDLVWCHTKALQTRLPHLAWTLHKLEEGLQMAGIWQS